MSKERRQAIDAAISQIERQFGRGAVMRLGGGVLGAGGGVVSSGSLSVDLALGVGGFPRGRVVEVYGPESGGKTTLALHVVAEAQRAGGVAAFVDAEHSLDAGYAGALGVDVGELLVSQPDSGEQALEIVELLVRSGAVDVVVVDSVAALTPRAELEGEMGDAHVGLQARLMSQALRKLTGVLSKSNTLALFINQVREKIGVLYGNPEVTPGGRALKFYASVRVEVRRKGDVKVGVERVGSRVRVRVTKNKVAPPFREAEVDILFGRGIDRVGDLVGVGVDVGVVEKSGSWFSFGGERLGQGKERVVELLTNRPELIEAIREKVMQQINSGVKPKLGSGGASLAAVGSSIGDNGAAEMDGGE